MAKSKSGIVIPFLILAIGIGWLLTNLEILPEVNLVWPGGLAAAGIITLVVHGINKGSIVLGPFLIVAAGLSVARQTGRMPLKIEVPILVVTLGALLLLSALSDLPTGLESGDES